MKSKLALLVGTLAACATWWTGCSSDNAAAVNANDAGGTAPETGGPGDPDTGAMGTEGGSPDAAKDTGVDSASSLGAFIPIAYGSANCPAFAACGGDPKGSWKITGGCVTEEILDEAKAQCPNLAESDVKFQARGTVVIDATKVTRKTEVEYTAKVAVPPECKPTMPPINTCAAVGQGLVLYAGFDSATCTDDVATGGCNCTIGDSFVDVSSDTYTTMDTTLTSGAGAGERTFEYCVNSGATELAYQETTAKALPATYVLGK